jgi:hypothetical protein
LATEFGASAAILDIDSIAPGFDFRRTIDGRLRECRVVLVMIGPRWANRLSEPTDFVRLEVETVLRREIPVVPVLVNGAALPAAAELPPSIQEIVYRHAVPLRSGQDFHRDVDRIADFIRTQQ